MVKFNPNERASIEELLKHKAFDSFRNHDIENISPKKIDLKMDYFPENKAGEKGEYCVRALKKYLKKLINESI